MGKTVYRYQLNLTAADSELKVDDEVFIKKRIADGLIIITVLKCVYGMDFATLVIPQKTLTTHRFLLNPFIIGIMVIS